jgi:hypothetical protein
MFRTTIARSSNLFFRKPIAITPIKPTPIRRAFTTTFKMSDKPVTAYPATEITAQNQEGGPGLDAKTEQKAEWSRLEFWDDNGKPYLKEYEGRGLLQNKAALITGGDSGIGRAVAILFAREGADVSIVYLPEEEEDAQYVKKKIEEAGRKANLMQFNLRDKSNCEKAVEQHMKVFGKLNVLVNNGMLARPSPCSSPNAVVLTPCSRHARNVHRHHRNRPRRHREDFPDKRHLYVRHVQICAQAHEARRLHRQQRVSRFLHVEPFATRLCFHKRSDRDFHPRFGAAAGAEGYQG